MPISVYFILFFALVAIAVFIYRDSTDYEHFKSLISTEERQAKLLHWLTLSFSVFGIGGVIGLWLMGHFNALFEMPDLIQLDLQSDDAIGEEGNGLSRMLQGFRSSFVYMIFIGVALGPLFHGFIQRQADKQGEAATKPKVIGDVEPLLPRNKRERFIAFWIALNAGVSEEIFFRLLLFICLTMVSNSIWIGIIGSTLLFGITHYYQGWQGVIATTGYGAIFMFLYLSTQHIWVPIALHIILDLNALLVVPWITRQMQSTS